MKSLLRIIVALLPVVLTSCEKELDFEYHDIDPITVIEGVLTPEGPQIAITLTTPMAEPMDRTRLTDATVNLIDITTGSTYALSPDAAGYYTIVEAQGIPGHRYGLVIERNDDRYETETEMYPATAITGIEFSWIKMPYDEVAVLQVQFTDNADLDDECYWIKIYRNGKIYRWGELNDRGAEDGIITYMTMTTRRDTDEEDDDDVLYDGDEITVSVSMISRAMYDYLEALQHGSNGPAMFRGPLCLGYFMATSTVTSSLIFSR